MEGEEVITTPEDLQHEADEEPVYDKTTEVLHDLQNSAQLWSKLVALTGGLMAFHKCSWQMLSWVPEKGQMRMRTMEEIRGSMHLEDHKGMKSKIKHKAHTAINVGLGFSIAPTGSMTEEFKLRLTQAKECSLKVVTATHNTAEAWLVLMMRILPKVTYLFMLT